MITLRSSCRRALVPLAAAWLVLAPASVSAQPSADAAARPGSGTLVREGVRMWYRMAGEAPEGTPPVVFLHGGPGQGSAHFDALAGPAMERSLRMVYFDQRGSGHSDRPASRDYAIPTLVEDVEALRTALGVPRIALVGHSFGGLLALEYAAKYPAHVASLVFVSGLWDTPMQCGLRLRNLARVRPDAYERVRGDSLRADGTRRSDCDLEGSGFQNDAEREAYFGGAMFPDPAVAARIDSVNAAHGIRNTGEMGQALFGGGLLEYAFRAHDRVTMPVLVIAGAHDGAALPAGLRELARRLPNARYAEFADAGHFVYLDETDRFAREVTAFIRGNRAEP